MGEEPDVIRRDIEDTRQRMGDTVDALGYKTDVKARAGDKVSALKDKVTGATPSSDDVRQNARRAAGTAQENPLGLAVAALAVGFIAGMLIPSTKIEDDKLGSAADEIKQQIKDTGSEALEHGRQVASAAADAAKETAREEGKQHADELKSVAQDNVQSAREEMTSS